MSTPTTHESAVGHVTGRAVYADEQHPPQGLLSLYPVQAPHAHARAHPPARHAAPPDHG